MVSLIIFTVIVRTVEETPTVQATPTEKADTSIGQYGDRPNANTPPPKTRTPVVYLPSSISGAEPLVKGCSLRFSFAPDAKTTSPEGSITYIVTLSNKGNQTCTNVSMSAYYADTEKFISSTPNPTASDYYWSVGNLSSNKSFKLTLTTKASSPDGGKIMSEACVAADNSQDICSDNVIFVHKDTPTGVVQVAHAVTGGGEGTVWGKSFNTKEFGVWVWDSPKTMTQTHITEVVASAAKNGFNVIYLTIDDYLPILQVTDQSERVRQKNAYMENLSSFIETAGRAGVAVDVEGGAKDWSDENNRWKGYALIDFVREYNQTYTSAQIRGLQYDVEPYLLSSYAANKEEVLKNFIAFIDESATKMQSVPATFSVVIPHFYDSTQKWTPQFEYEGQRSYTFTHLLRILEQKKGSTIILMAYRNFFEGEDGIREIAEPEISEATQGNYSTKVVIAEETGDVTPDYVTFHNSSKGTLFNTLSEIQQSFRPLSHFNGMAVHYFDSFLKLE